MFCFRLTLGKLFEIVFDEENPIADETKTE